MDALLQFFQGIGNAITAFFDFVFSFLGDLVYLVQLTGKFLSAIPGYFAWLPPELLALIGFIFTIVVLYKVIGREG